MRRRRHRILNLNRQKCHPLVLRACILLIRGEARIAKSLVEQIGVHRIPRHHLRNRYARCPRLAANRALLVIRPKPLLLTLLARHRIPQDVHYRCWTLSSTPSRRQSQSGETGRVRSKSPPPQIRWLPVSMVLYTNQNGKTIMLGTIDKIINAEWFYTTKHAQILINT